MNMAQEIELKYQGLFKNTDEEVHIWKPVRDKRSQIKTWRLVDMREGRFVR